MCDLEHFLRENKALLVADSVDHCLDLVRSGGSMGGPFYYYRGVTNSEYKLLTSLDRFPTDSPAGRLSNRRWREQFLVEQFTKVAHNHLPPMAQPQGMFQWFSMMQHYGVPTRFLDLTRSPYVALYFAVRDWQTDADAALWSFNPTAFHERALHLLATLGFSKKITRHSIFHLREFVNDSYFREAFLTGKYPIVAILEPAWADQRLSSQQGAFLIAGSLEETMDVSIATSLRDDSYMDRRKAEFIRRGSFDWSVVKLVIPRSLKKKLASELRRMNVHAGTLFPGLEGAARSIAELSSNDQLTDMTWRPSFDT